MFPGRGVPVRRPAPGRGPGRAPDGSPPDPPGRGPGRAPGFGVAGLADPPGLGPGVGAWGLAAFCPGLGAGLASLFGAGASCFLEPPEDFMRPGRGVALVRAAELRPGFGPPLEPGRGPGAGFGAGPGLGPGVGLADGVSLDFPLDAACDLRAAGFAGLASPVGSAEPIWSRSRRTTGASMVEEAERTNSPMSLSFPRSCLLDSPSSFASS